MTRTPDALSAHATAALAPVAPRARPELLRDRMPHQHDMPAAASPPVADIALWSAVYAAPAGTPGADTSSNGPAPGVPPSPLPVELDLHDLHDLDPLATELGAQVNAAGSAAADACTFQVELPGLGTLSGRVTIRADQQVDLELKAMNTTVATALRARRRALQHGIAHGTERDVNLFIL